MLYEYRRYTACPGRMPALHARMATTAMGLFAQHGIEVVGAWQPLVGRPVDELHYLVRWDSLDDCRRAWAAFAADERWQQARAASEADGPLLARIENQIWRATDYSPAL